MAIYLGLCSSGRQITPQIAFPILLLMEMRYAINLSNDLISNWTPALTSLKAIEDFLSGEEHVSPFLESKLVGVISFKQAVFEAGLPQQETDDEVGNDNHKKKFQLKIDDLHVGSGFLGVCGPVGCGKSSFLAALVGELRLVEGEVSIQANDRYRCRAEY